MPDAPYEEHFKTVLKMACWENVSRRPSGCFTSLVKGIQLVNDRNVERERNRSKCRNFGTESCGAADGFDEGFAKDGVGVGLQELLGRIWSGTKKNVMYGIVPVHTLKKLILKEKGLIIAG